MASRRIKLTYTEELITRPLIWELGHDFGLVTNIRRADVTTELAWAILEVTGEPSDIEAGLAWAQSIGVRVDPVEDSIMDG